MTFKSIQSIRSLFTSLSRLPRNIKRFTMVLADTVMVPVALWCAISLHAGHLNSEFASNGWLYLAATGLLIPVFVKFGLYRAVVRFMGTKAVFAVLQGVLIALALFGVATRFLFEPQVPLNVVIIFALFCLLWVGGSRLAVRAMFQRANMSGDRVAIYGAGDAGAHLAASLFTSRKYMPVVFLDDSRTLAGSVINGIEVYSPDELPELIELLGISRVLLAVPSATRRRRRKIIERLESLPVRIQTMPVLADLISGVTQIDEIREVDVADLLGRDTVPPNDSLLGACIRDKVVMVTGAGGSIGSELCRQIVNQNPAQLVLLEMSELALYNIDKELSMYIARDNQPIKLVPLLGSTQQKERVQEIMSTFGVDTVYHAAAYKHVPMVERNVIEGICNNVFGTLHCAEAAIEANVETFVLVSTDKAVCPTNVMGATKRLAEMVLQGLDERGSNTCFCMVRFGNVLASSGSVVPLFREQIERGGPLTVTHPEIIRYFMTIPEAAQLVLQAGSMGTGGDVFLLDMGKPVRIEDLARRMIHLMGMTVMDDENPDGDIEIEYTGLRPAEKLYEELLIGSKVMGTEHSMIMRAEEKRLPWSEIKDVLRDMKDATASLDGRRAVKVLKNVVEEYVPAGDVVDLVWVEQQSSNRLVPSSGKVMAIATKKPVSS